MRVSLPQWVLDQDLMHQKKKVQHNSMAKQFGSLGKKFRKNLAKMTSQTKSHRDHIDHSRSKVVSANQSFILGNFFRKGIKFSEPNDLAKKSESYLQQLSI